ncbi:MAG TPA: hypothetical protein VEL07_22385 [Planctomycetota bacterium]|nr:hypothetical protein [Planctomycetota bacterium]
MNVTEGSEPDELDLLDAVYRCPRADGEVITDVAGDGQAHAVGMRRGDLITAYAGRALDAATSLTSVQAATPSGCVIVDVLRGARALRFEVQAGRLGIDTDVLHAGVDSGLRAPRPVPLPPATADALDWSRLRMAPIDCWHRFLFGDPERHVGFAHFTAALSGTEVRCAYDWCFDSGDYGLIGDCTASRITIAGGDPVVLASRSEGNDGSWVSGARREIGPGGGALWVARRRQHLEDGSTSESSWSSAIVPDAPPLGALQLQLAGFLARRVGVCRHYGFAAEGEWMRLAMRVESLDDIALPDGRHREAWQICHHYTNGPGIRTWVGDDGTLLRIDFGPAYGEARSTMASRADATAGLNPAIRVRDAATPV